MVVVIISKLPPDYFHILFTIIYINDTDASAEIDGQFVQWRVNLCVQIPGDASGYS